MCLPLPIYPKRVLEWNRVYPAMLLEDIWPHLMAQVNLAVLTLESNVSEENEPPTTTNTYGTAL